MQINFLPKIAGAGYASALNAGVMPEIAAQKLFHPAAHAVRRFHAIAYGDAAAIIGAKKHASELALRRFYCGYPIEMPQRVLRDRALPAPDTDEFRARRRAEHRRVLGLD